MEASFLYLLALSSQGFPEISGTLNKGNGSRLRMVKEGTLKGMGKGLLDIGNSVL